MNKRTVAEQRLYSVLNVQDAKDIAFTWLKDISLENAIDFGLPEVDDRYHIWRVPLLQKYSNRRLGEIAIDAKTSLILLEKTTASAILEARLLGREHHDSQHVTRSKKSVSKVYELSDLRNTIALGDSEQILQMLPVGSIDLVFTSPPYYNAKPEYSDYVTYEEYLLKIRKVVQLIHHVMAEGRFLS